MSKKQQSANPIAVSLTEAAAAFGLSEDVFRNLERDGVFSPAVKFPGYRIKRYDYARLHAEWQVYRENIESEHEDGAGKDNPWDVS